MRSLAKRTKAKEYFFLIEFRGEQKTTTKIPIKQLIKF